MHGAGLPVATPSDGVHITGEHGDAILVVKAGDADEVAPVLDALNVPISDAIHAPHSSVRSVCGRQK